jgi:hypothetical protein
LVVAIFISLTRRSTRWDGKPLGSPILFILVAGDSERTVAMLRLIWTISVHVRTFMRRYMPTNIALDALRSRRGLKWGIPGMLVAIPYLYAASLLTALIDGGASKWLFAFTVILIWDAFKFVAMGPVSFVTLLRVRAAESRQRRALRRPVGPLIHL